MGSRTSTSVAATLESFQRQRRKIFQRIQRRKMDKQRILLCLFAWMVAQVSGTNNEQARLNERAIESQWLTLEDSVMRDVLELKESFNKIVGDINTAFGEYRAFTEGSVTELNLHIDSEMKQNDEALEENTKLLEDFTKSQVKEMDKTLLENLQTLSTTMAQERSSIVSWAHQRSTFHEDILKTDVALCAFDYDDEKRTGVPITTGGTVVTSQIRKAGGCSMRPATRSRAPRRSSTGTLAGSRCPRTLMASTCSPSPSPWTPSTTLRDTPGTTITSGKTATRSLELDSMEMWDQIHTVTCSLGPGPSSSTSKLEIMSTSSRKKPKLSQIYKPCSAVP